VIDSPLLQSKWNPDTSSHARTCTDLLPLALYFLFWLGMVTHFCLPTRSDKPLQIAIALFAFAHGDIYRLLYGSDSFGNTCGRKNRALLVQTEDNATDPGRPFPLSGRDMTDKT
jgi:hypothetical protein